MIDKNKKKVLVLGATGLLGHHCFQLFKKNFQNCIGTYNTTSNNQPDYLQFDATSDIHVLDKVLSTYQPDLIVNTIAYVTVDGCEKKPDLAYKLNAQFVKELVEALKRNGLSNRHLIQISSDSVYGNKDSIRPWREEDATEPLSIYAKTKLQGEHFAETHEGPVSILRTAFYGINVYSDKSLLSWIISNARKGVPMNGWENIYFCPVSAETLSSIISQIFQLSATGIFNVGSTDMCNKYDFVFEVCNSLNLNAKVNRFKKDQEDIKNIRPNDTTLDSSKLASIIDWHTKWKEDLNVYLNNIHFQES